MSPDRHERAASAGGRARARRSALYLRNGALPGLWPASFHQSIEPQVARRKRGIAGGHVSARPPRALGRCEGTSDWKTLEHEPEKACPALDAGWVPVFPRDKRKAFARRSCSNKKIERDDDSKKSHPDLVGAAQPSHCEFDVAIGQFAPAFDLAHIGGLGIAGEEVARLGPRLVARQGEGLTQIAVIQLLPPAGHPVGKIARARGHVATPDRYRPA